MSRPARAFLSSLIAAAIFGVGCGSSPTAPTPSTTPLLPAADSFACGSWEGVAPLPPPMARAVADIEVVPGSSQTAPSESGIQALEAAGATILYRFHGPLVRASIDIAVVPSLENKSLAWVKGVADRNAYPITVVVVLDHDPTDADVSAATALGGTVKSVFHVALHGYAVTIDDSQVTALRALPGVQYAEFDSITCALAASG